MTERQWRGRIHDARPAAGPWHGCRHHSGHLTVQLSGYGHASSRERKLADGRASAVRTACWRGVRSLMAGPRGARLADHRHVSADRRCPGAGEPIVFTRRGRQQQSVRLTPVGQRRSRPGASENSTRLDGPVGPRVWHDAPARATSSLPTAATSRISRANPTWSSFQCESDIHGRAWRNYSARRPMRHRWRAGFGRAPVSGGGDRLSPAVPQVRAPRIPKRRGFQGPGSSCWVRRSRS